MGALDAPGPSWKQMRGRMDWYERLAREGLPYATTATFSGTASVGVGFGGAFALPGITRAMWVESAHISANKNIVVQINLTASALGAGFTDAQDIVLAPGNPFVIPMRQLIRPSQLSTAQMGSCAVRNLIDADNTNAFIRASLVGWNITDDLDYGAEKVALWIGDSVTAGGTGPTNKVNQYDWRIMGYLKGLGRSVRMVNMSMSGTTSVNAERRRQHGDYDLHQVDHVFYSMGTNDASGAVAPATYKANVAAAIAWKQARFPAATMTVFGVTPLENSTHETAAAILRTNAAAAVTEAGDVKVKFLDLGGAFDRAVSANYASTDTPGSRVHPNDTGHAAIWAVVSPFLAANPILA